MRDGRSVCPVCPAGLPSRGQMYFRRWKVRLRSAVKGQPASRRGRSVPARARLPLRQGVMGTLHHRPHVEPNCRRTVTNRYGRYTWSRPVPNGPNGPGSSHFIPSGPERSRAPLTWIDDKMCKNRPSAPFFATFMAPPAQFLPVEASTSHFHFHFGHRILCCWNISWTILRIFVFDPTCE